MFSLPPKENEEGSETISQAPLPEPGGLYPVATIEERRRAAWIDVACIGFAYGAFLTLFGSLGGHFAFDKLNAAVHFFTFAFVYLQYFSCSQSLVARPPG